MDSDRHSAKSAIRRSQEDDYEFDQAIREGSSTLALKREDNRHRERMARVERGWLGILLGGEKHAPVAIALFAVIAGVLIAGGCYYQAATGGSFDFWGRQAERALAFAAVALGFIFGRGPR